MRAVGRWSRRVAPLPLERLLGAGVLGYPVGFLLAIGLTVVQLVHFAVHENGITAFPVQVRLFYLIVLLVALAEPLRVLYWLATIGTWALVIFGYCASARTVSLLPWNKSEPFSGELLLRTFLSRPVRGSIMQGLPPVR